jgi:surface protein
MPSTLRLFLVGALMLGAVVYATPAAAAPLPASFDPHQAAADVARAIGDGDLRQLAHLIVVTDTQAADAVSAAGLAGYHDNSGRTGRTAVLLTSPTTLPAPTAQAITDSGVSAERIYVVGGTAAVADSVRDAIARAAGWNGTGTSPVQRIAGVDRYATAAAVLDHVRSIHGANLPESYRTVVVTNGEHLSDALSAGSLAYTHGHLVVLSPAHAAPPITIDALSSFDARCAFLVGGPGALSARVSEQVIAALGENDCAPRMHGSNRRTTSIAVADHTVTTSRVPTEVFLAPDSVTPLTAAAAPLARRHRVILSTHTGSLSEEVRNWLRQHRPMRVDVVPGAGTHFIDTSVLADARASRLSTSPDTAAGPTPDPDPTPDPATSVRFSIETTSADQTFELPLRGTVDVIIDWGDGGANACTRRVTTSGNVPCTFAQVGTYDIAIGRGSDTGPWLTQLGDGDTTYPGVNVITAVQSFGDLGIESLSGFLHGGGNPTMPADIPSTVTDLSFMFRNATTFNQNITSWNTFNVTDMSFMFSNTGAFNQPIGNWDLTQVTDLHHMFSGASAFNRNLSAWNTANVVNMAGVFAFAGAFNNGCAAGVTTCPLQWDTSAVESMFEMFRNASVFNQDINNDADGNWNTANVTDFERMFEDATAFNQDLSSWCVSGVGAAPFNFASGTPAGFTGARQPQWGTCPEPASSLSLTIQTTTANQTMALPLRGTVNVAIDWGDNGANNCPTSATSGVDITCTYATAGTYNIAVRPGSGPGPWLTGLGPANSTYTGVTLITAIDSFGELGIQSLSGLLRTGGNPTMPAVLPATVTDLSHMFAVNTTFNRNISAWDTSNVTDMWSMFANSEAFNQNLSSWDTSKVTRFQTMFLAASTFNNGCAPGVTTCPLQWDTSAATTMLGMFERATVFNQDIGSWNTAQVTDMSWMFREASAFNQDLSGWCVPQIGTKPDNFDGITPAWTKTDRQPKWGTCPEPASSLSLTIQTTTTNQTMALPLRGTVNVTIDWGDNGANNCPTSAISAANVTCTYANAGTYNIAVRPGSGPGPWLTQFGAGDSFPGTDLITAINSFGELGIQSLYGLLYRGGNPTMPAALPPTVTVMWAMFALNTSFNRNISGWHTSNVIDMTAVFLGATSFNQNLSSWDTSQVVNFMDTFSGASAFNNGCLPGDSSCPLTWDTSKATMMIGTFEQATVFNQDIGSWDTSKVTNMTRMFSNASAFNQDLSSWCVSLVGTTPFNFDINTTAWNKTNRQPVWGSCPAIAS